MPRNCYATFPTGRGPDRPGDLTLDLTATDHRSEVGRRLAELLSLHRRRLRHRHPHPDRLDHGLALYPGRGCVWLARVRLLVPAARPSVDRVVSARGCPMARRCPLARRPAAGLSQAVCWARFPTARWLRLRPRFRGRVFGMGAPRRRPFGVARLAATGYWRDRPEGGFRRGLVPGSGLRRRASRRGVAEATVTCVPRLLLAFPPVAPLWDLGRRNENDRPAPPDPPRLPPLTRPYRGRSRHIGSRRISPWHLLFCHCLSETRTFRLNSNLSKLTVELKEVPYLPKLLSRAHPRQIPFVFRSVGAFCLNSIFRQKLWTDLFLKLFPCLAQFLAGDFQKGEE